MTRQKLFWLLLLPCLAWPGMGWGAFPQTAAPTQTAFTASETTTHNVVMPATVNSNGLLIVLVAMYSTPQLNADPVIATPSGWTQLAYTTEFSGSSGDHVVGVYVKIATGDEDGASVDFVTTATCRGVAHAYHVTGWEGTSSGWSIATAVVGGPSTTPDPGSLSPAWGSADTLWFELSMATDDDETFTAASASYTGLASTNAAGGVDNSVSIGSARRENTTATEDPGTMTLDSSGIWIAYTMAVRPGSAGNGGAPTAGMLLMLGELE